ncbi:DUF669 domain-containing protein [uncultured Ruminococcus sp.]|uniref:DUF669 domain-containing protein n=1 Tax=uncultured Ruminococcus sp. TaxID=165186 RepID=UPI0025F44721|nr:DUF669 domain-containing protein [uncultured Ruminococcus sp.]
MAYDQDFFEYGWEDMISDEGKEFVLLPEGDYDFTVSKIERARHAGSEKMPPCNMAKVTVTVWGKEDKIEITENLFLCNKMEWKLSQFFLSIGLKKHGEPLKMNWAAAQGRSGKCHVYVDTYKKKDGSEGKSNKIRKFHAYDDNVQTVSPQANAQQGYNTQPQGGYPQQGYSQPQQGYSQPQNYNAPPVNGGWKAGSF